MFMQLSSLRRLALVLVPCLWVGVALADAAGPAPVPVVTAPAPPAAAAMPAATVAVTWDDIARAAGKSPLLAAGAANVAASQAGARATAIAPNPSLSASAAYVDPKDSTASGTEWGLEIEIPIGWLASRQSQVRAARAGVAVSEADAEALRREALGQLRELFWQVVIGQRRVATLTELDGEEAKLARAVTLRVDRGDARPVEQARIEVEAEKLSGEVEAARLELAGDRARLGAWLRLPPGAVVEAVADADALPLVFDPATARSRSASDPRVAAAQARVRQMEAEAQTERLGRLPEVSVAPFVDNELDQRRSGVGVTTPLPLWDWNTARVAQADARVSAARAELDNAELTAESDALSAQAGCEAAVTVAGRFRDRVVPRAQSAAALVGRAYELGEADLTETIDARRTLLNTQTEYLDALSRARSECGRLYAAIGEDAP